jgi:hypothetical protein
MTVPQNQLLDRINLVHPTELGTPLVEYLLAQLAASDKVPCLLGDGTTSRETKAAQISTLIAEIDAASTLDDAVTRVRSSPYFEAYVSKQTTMIEQIRNRVPADTAIVYRAKDGDFWLESMFSASSTDPVSRLAVDQRLVPSTKVRTAANTLRRRTFDLHELADSKFLLESHTYRVIFDDLRVSWHAIVLDRDRDFTWIIFFWYRLRDPQNPGPSVLEMRAGFELIAESLARKFSQARSSAPRAYKQPNSLQRGLLVLQPNFVKLFRQNFAAEAIIQGLVDQEQVPPLRTAIYSRIALEHERRLRAGLDLSWTVDSCFHPTEISHNPSVVRVAVRTYTSSRNNRCSGQHEVVLKEIHTPHLPRLQRWWELPLYKRDSKLGKALKDLGEQMRATPPADLISPSPGRSITEHLLSLSNKPALHLETLSGIARPVWDVDLVANRITTYPQVPAGKIGRAGYNREQLKRDRLWAITYHTNTIVGVLHAL